MRNFEEFDNFLQDQKYPSSDLKSFAFSERDFMKQIMEHIYEDTKDSNFIGYLFQSVHSRHIDDVKISIRARQSGYGISRFKEEKKIIKKPFCG